MHDNDFSMGRRRMLKLGAATIALSLGGGIRSGAATEDAGVFRRSFGDAELMVVSDGPMHVGDPHANYPSAPEAEIASVVAKDGYPNGELVFQQNCVVLKEAGRVVLVDTGMGPNQLFGDTTGKLQANLANAGLKAEDVTHVLLTHPHLDHAGGLLAVDGSAAFRNAQVFLVEDDYRFWTDETNFPSNSIPAKVAAGVKAALTPVSDRLQFFNPGQEPISGIQSILTPGHTAKHTAFVVELDGQRIILVGDVLHHTMSIAHPDWAFGGDLDPAQAVATRAKLIDMIAMDELKVLSFHFAFPGLGTIRRSGASHVFELEG